MPEGAFKIMSPDKLLDALSEQEILGVDALSRAQTLSQTSHISLEAAILKLNLLEEDILLRVIANLLEISYFEGIDEFLVDTDTVELLTLGYCRTNSILPIKDADGGVIIISAHPNDVEHLAELEFYLGPKIVRAAGSTQLIRQSLNAQIEQPSNEPPSTQVSGDRASADLETFEKSEFDGPAIRHVNALLEDAISSRASDIHFESQEDGLRVRFRIDGQLIPQSIDRTLNVSSILARVKVLSGMNVSERRLPQDGRISFGFGGRKIDFRVSSVPTSFGESIVCRVLDPKALRLGWDKLGFDTDTTAKILHAIERPSGLFLVTGPTGSGKTTTLYTALAHLNDESRKILTVEDPVEYNLHGVEQVQVHEEIGMTFSKALRAFLRQDPNVVMIGEIRDQETAEIACRAALIGRMVLSTLHTNSPEGAVTRLIDLGVPEYIVRDVLRGVLGQRLEPSTETGRVLKAEFKSAAALTET